MSLESHDLDAAARMLWDAQATRTPCDPLTEQFPAINIDDAYRIQLQNIDRRRATGRRVIGHKVGLSAKAMQQMVGVNEPDYGHLLDDMVVYEADSVSMTQLLQPRIEVEVAFVLGRRLVGPGVTVSDVLRATDFVVPSLEIVDSRVSDWRIKIQDTVADNASAGVFVLGSRMVDPHSIDLNLCGMVLERNGELVATGAGAAALGSPVNAVAWLANALGGFGMSLTAGEVILSGSLAAMIPVQRGDRFRMQIGGIGDCSVRFE